MWWTDGFSVTFFWKVEGTVRIHVNSYVAHVWLPYMVINVWGGGNSEHRKTRKVRKTSIFSKGGGEHQRSYWIS